MIFAERTVLTTFTTKVINNLRSSALVFFGGYSNAFVFKIPASGTYFQNTGFLPASVKLAAKYQPRQWNTRHLGNPTPVYLTLVWCTSNIQPVTLVSAKRKSESKPDPAAPEKNSLLILFEVAGIRIQNIQNLVHPCTTMLNMIRFPGCVPTGFCNSDPDWTGFWKNSTGSDMDM